jgi:hypothetical protein
MNGQRQPIPILLFADSILGVHPYDWQSKILLNYEAGFKTAAACANYSGKTSTIFPICALWVLYCHPRARVMYVSATQEQVRRQYFATLSRFRSRPAFRGWEFMTDSVSSPQGGCIFGRAVKESGHIEGQHDEPDSPASILVDEAKTVDPNVLETFERCTTSFRLFMSSTGQASGGFYRLMSANDSLWKRHWIKTSDCPHVDPALIEEDRLNLKDNTFAVKHDARWVYDEGNSMVSLEHVRSLIACPPPFVPGPATGFCDFAGGRDETAFATCVGNRVEVKAWRQRDTMASVGDFLHLFEQNGFTQSQASYLLGGDEGYGHSSLDRMQEKGWAVRRFNNGAAPSPEKVGAYHDLAAEWWGTVGELIRDRKIILPDDETLIRQLTLRLRISDSDGRDRLEPKHIYRAREGGSPDRADAVVGAVMLQVLNNKFAFDPAGRQQMTAQLQQCSRLMERSRSVGYMPHIDFSQW